MVVVRMSCRRSCRPVAPEPAFGDRVHVVDEVGQVVDEPRVATVGRLQQADGDRVVRAHASRAVLRDLDGLELTEHLALCDDDLTARNTAEQPDRVVPRARSGARVEGGRLRAELPPRWWNVVRLGP